MISASLRLLGVLAEGETPTAEQAQDALSALNMMIDSWSTEGLLIYAKVEEEFTLTPGDQQYTMGDGADFDTARPVRIVKALLRDETQTPAIDRPIDILNLDRWSSLTQKGLESSYPFYLYAEGTHPNETINIYPKPTVAHKLVLFSWKTLSRIATLDTEISLPPGYDRAIKFNLPVDLAPEYGRSVSIEVATIAKESKTRIKRVNHRPSYLKADEALLERRRYNIFSGGPE